MTIQVPIQKIESVKDHPNADRLSLIRVGEHTVVSMKNEDGTHRFKDGEAVVYVPQNAIIPDDLLKATGFWDKINDKGELGGSAGNRVVNRKIRGIESEGLIWKLVDICIYLDKGEKNFDPQNHLDDWKDISTELGITEYVTEAPLNDMPVSSEARMIKFPSLEQYRTAISNVKQRARYRGKDENGDPIYETTGLLPTLKYKGTVKLHGTNAAIVRVYEGIEKGKDASNIKYYQSRERILSIGQDNAGFMLNMESKAEVVDTFLWELFCEFSRLQTWQGPVSVAVFGEWCGSGIQSGVAISETSKKFVIFGIRIVNEEESYWIDQSARITAIWQNSKVLNTNGIWFIDQFPSWEVEIDFNHPELAQNELIRITEAVEAECPVGKVFGVLGVGEGVVWTSQTEGWRSYDFAFKVKGEKHSVSKVKTLAAVDVEAVQALKDFVDNTVTEPRLEQGLHNLVHEQLKPFEMSSMGDFIRWVYNDVLKEESDTIVRNQIEIKKLGSAIANKARPWFTSKINS